METGERMAIETVGDRGPKGGRKDRGDKERQLEEMRETEERGETVRDNGDQETRETEQ